MNVDAAQAAAAGVDTISTAFENNAEVRASTFDGAAESSYEIRRDAIVTIAHPGFAAGVTGTVITIVGLGLLGWGIGETAAGCDHDGGELCGLHHTYTTLPGAILAAGGLGTMLPGWVIYSNSKSAMEPDAVAASHTVQLLPVATPVRGKMRVGVGARGTW